MRIKKCYYVVDKEKKNFITRCRSFEEGIRIIKEFERQDKGYDCFSEGYYMVVDENTVVMPS